MYRSVDRNHFLSIQMRSRLAPIHEIRIKYTHFILLRTVIRCSIAFWYGVAWCVCVCYVAKSFFFFYFFISSIL